MFRIFVHCSWFFKAFLVVVKESPQCQCCLGGLAFECRRSQGQQAHRGGLWSSDGLLGSTTASVGVGSSIRQGGVLATNSG